MGALYKGFLTTAILSIPALYLVTWWVLGDMDAPIGGGFTGEGAFTGMDLFWSMLVGLAVTGLIVWITEYYTCPNHRLVLSLAKASVTGHGTRSVEHTPALQPLMPLSYAAFRLQLTSLTHIPSLP